jgi:DNA-binding LytR/AlgR family response regulator
MRIAIVEDEAVVARRLVRMVGQIVPAAELEVAPTLAAALALVHARRPDLLLLDLDLGGRDGFALLAEALAAPVPTIVVSAHHDQALRAFEYGVVDFVVKPWTAERLGKALARAAGRAGGGGAAGRSLVVRCGRELRSVPISSVVFARGADDYSELHLVDGSVHLHERGLTGLAALLPPTFARVHRSFLVDLARARGLRSAPGGRLALVLTDGREVPVGRRHRPALRARLGL